MMKVDEKVNYYDQDVAHVWGGREYRESYGQGICYGERDVPYNLNKIKENTETVFEIGSAMGQCYRWLLSRNIRLGNRYTGTDISKDGIETCRQLYPEANWIQGDFSQGVFDKQYDYLHERNAIHHMPNPIHCIKKAVAMANNAVVLNGRSRVFYPSVSDLNKSFFVQWSDDGRDIVGKYFFNLLRVSDIINAILSVPNVKRLRVELSPHFKFSKSGPTREHNFVVPEDAFDEKETLYHCYSYITKGKSSRPELEIKFASFKQAIKQPLDWLRFSRNKDIILKSLEGDYVLL